MEKIRDTIYAIIIGIIGIIIFTILLPQKLSSINEAKRLLDVQALWYHGWQLIPQTNFYHSRDINFSIVPTLAYLSAKLMNYLSFFTIRVPTIVASAITLAFTYLIGSLRMRTWGLLAVFFVLGSDIFLLTSRSLSISPYITALTTMTLFAVITLEPNPWFFYPVFVGLCLLGFLIQGSMGLLLVTLMTLLYFFWRLQLHQFTYSLITALIVFMIAFLCLIEVTINQGGMILGKELIYSELNHILPHYHIWNLNDWLNVLCYSASLPVAIVTIMVRWHQLLWVGKVSWDIKLLRCLITWSIAVLVLTIFLSRPLTFALPMIPALALIAAHLFTHRQDGRIVQSIRQLILFILVLVPFFALAITLTVSLIHLFKPISTPLISKQYYIDCIVLIALFCLLTLFIRLRQTAQNLKTYDYLALSFLALVAYLVVVIAIAPIHKLEDNYQVISQKLSRLLNQKPENIIFYDMGLNQVDTMIIAYLNMKPSIHKTLTTKPPLFIKNSEKLLAQKQIAYVIIPSKTYQQLPASVKKKMTVLTKHRSKQNILIVNYQPHLSSQKIINKKSLSKTMKQSPLSHNIQKPLSNST